MFVTMNFKNEESFCFGLGYSHHLSRVDPSPRDLNGPPQQGGSSSINGVCDATSAADMAQAMMMQCLAYHQEQEAIRQQTNLRDPTRLRPEPETFPEFVCSSDREINLPQSYKNTQQQTTPQQPPDTGHAINKNAISPSNCTSSDAVPKSLHSLVEAAKSRARAVLAQFSHTSDLPLTSGKSRLNEDDNNAASDPELSFQPQTQTQHPPHYYAQQREVGLQREEQRKHQALLRNFEYVAHRESERIGMLQAAQDQVAHWEQIGQQQYQKNLEIRRELLQKGHGGIHIDSQRQPKRPRNNPQKQPQEKPPATTVAIYVSGFPIVGPDAVSEDSVRQLFGAYGKVARVHLYRDHRNQALKGDGLIVYSIDEQLDIASFLASVCGQVRSRSCSRILLDYGVLRRYAERFRCSCLSQL